MTWIPHLVLAAVIASLIASCGVKGDLRPYMEVHPETPKKEEKK
ncbi:MAG: lipoprotein [Deltaproteobacteria bacterium]|nr:lipoprotein [Deltaproteobacteria bacterium]MBI3294860.1 lipoprotein [Deltaproteobacteria bacterium]